MAKQKTVEPKVEPTVEPTTTIDAIPLKRICSEAKIDPKLARRKLRKAKFAFHAAKDRWTFAADSAELAEVRKILGANPTPKAVAIGDTQAP